MTRELSTVDLELQHPSIDLQPTVSEQFFLLLHLGSFVSLPWLDLNSGNSRFLANMI